VGRYTAVRNVGIVVLIAAAVYALPSGGTLASTVGAVLGVALGAAIALLALRGYREYRERIYLLGDRHRALFYGSLALAVYLYVAHTRMWRTGTGQLLWILLALAALWGLVEVYRRYRAY